MSIIAAGIPVPTSGEGAFVDVSTMVGPKTVVFSGRFQGIYELLGSHDDSHFVPILQFDAGGVEGVRQTIAGSFRSMRLRAATPATSPGPGVACEVSAVVGVGQNYFATIASLAAGAAPGLTPVIDLAPLYPPTGPEEDICFLCEGGLQGQLVVLGSLDGVDFCPVGSYRRDRVPEGAPISTEFSVLSSPDKVRYVRLLLDGEAADAVVVTIGGRVPLTVSLPETLAQTYAAGGVPADQTMVLEDARGGQVVIDATDAGFTGLYALTVMGRAVELQAGLVLGTGLAPPGESDLVVGPGAAVVSVADSGRLGYLAGGTQQFMVSANGGAYVPVLYGPTPSGFSAGSVPFGNGADGQLAQDSAFVWDSAGTLLLGGAFALPSSSLRVRSSLFISPSPGTRWNGMTVEASTLTLSGGPVTVTQLSLARIEQATIDTLGFVNTVSDAYDLLVDAAPVGTATLTRSWSIGAAGAVQAQAGLVLGAGLAPPGESDLVIGPGATIVSVASSGRLGYVAGGTQQFMVSQNGGAYVPLLTAPAAAGFTTGSIPFGTATGTLGQDNANLFWDNTNKRLGIDVAASPTARLHLAGVTTVAGTASLKINAGTLLSSVEVGAVESDGTNLYWTDGGGVRRQLNNAASVASTLALAYAAGSAAADQTLALLDAKGGGLVVDATAAGFTGASALTISGAGGGTIAFSRTGCARLGAGQTVAGKQILIGASPYTVLDTDYILEVQSNGGAITVNLPALTGGTQLNGRIVITKDSGYNAAVSNITLAVGNAADKIENGVAGASRTVNVSGQCLWLKANTTNANWEII